MPVDFHVIKASEFISVDANEYLNFEASKQTLQSLATACRKRGLNCALLDLRTLPVIAKPHFTKSELSALVLSFREAGFTRDLRLAVLYRHDEHGGIRDFAFISRLRGLQVRAFQDFEVAAHWLSEGQPSPPECAQPGDPVAISKPASSVKVAVGGQTSLGPGATGLRLKRRKANRQR